MERNPIYDRAKGIGMILVIYGHMFDYGGISFSIIFSFHMPFFLLFLECCSRQKKYITSTRQLGLRIA